MADVSDQIDGIRTPDLASIGALRIELRPYIRVTPGIMAHGQLKRMADIISACREIITSIVPEIGDGNGGKSRRVGADQQAGRDCRYDRPSPAAARPILR